MFFFSERRSFNLAIFELINCHYHIQKLYKENLNNKRDILTKKILKINTGFAFNEEKSSNKSFVLKIFRVDECYTKERFICNGAKEFRETLIYNHTLIVRFVLAI